LRRRFDHRVPGHVEAGIDAYHAVEDGRRRLGRTVLLALEVRLGFA
jgi:hypothetical protein